MPRDKRPGAPGPAYCCEPDCEKDAEFAIFDGTIEGETHACTDHVGTMLTSPVDGPEITSWTVTPITAAVSA